MLILLPPSETKSSGGDGAPLDLAALSFPSLTPVRESIAADLTALASGDADAAREVLGLGPKLAAEVAADADLMSSPTAPALDRYTGVLFDALDAPTLPPAARAHLAVGSALFGVVGAEDPIPRYRLSGTVKLPEAGSGGAAPTMRARWGKAITEALEATGEFIVDLRSGAYMNLGKVPGAVTCRVETADGKVVSHFNKHHKGLLARALALAAADGAEVTDAEGAAAVARDAGLDARVDDSGRAPLLVVTVRD
ncbi:YaaA family protein [Corynebacterium sp. 335C]